MPSGGARAKAGPAPSPTSGASDRKGLTFKALPPEGYAGPVPDFPLSRQSNEVLAPIEERVWAHAWTLPQAAAWAAEPWRIYVVAQWARVAALCETTGATAADRTSMLRLQEEIGLTGPGLARNGWTIGPAAKPEEAPKPRQRKSARDRLTVRVIDGGKA